MRRRLQTLLLVLCLFSGVCVTYLLFQQRPINFDFSSNGLGRINAEQEMDAKILDTVKKLEAEFQSQYDMNKMLLMRLQEWKKKRLEVIDEMLAQSALDNAASRSNQKPSSSEKAVGDPVEDPDAPPRIVVLVIACNRPTVKRCLDQLLKYRTDQLVEQFPIVVSQDCQHPETSQVIEEYGNSVTHIRQPNQDEIVVPEKELKFKGYFKISRHYGWAINETMNILHPEAKAIVIVEDDLDVAPDFYEYFLGTYPVLRGDRSLWCVSAWNDNGKQHLVNQSAPELIYRSDFFPGLGWMLTKNLWQDELMLKWPPSYWDDWMRMPEQKRGRACLRPELSRTRTFGKVGVSNGMFFEKHLKFIHLSDRFVPFTKHNLTYLTKEVYDVDFVKEVYSSPVVNVVDIKMNKIDYDVGQPVRVVYHTKDAYKKACRLLGLMDDFKSGVPRTAYRGIVSFFFNNRRIYLAPNANWKGYDASWS